MQSRVGTYFVLPALRQAGELVRAPGATVGHAAVNGGPGGILVGLCDAEQCVSAFPLLEILRQVYHQSHCLSKAYKIDETDLGCWKICAGGYPGRTLSLSLASKQRPKPLRLHRGEGVSSHPGALKSTELARRSKHPGNLNSCRVILRRYRTRSSAHQIPV